MVDRRQGGPGNAGKPGNPERGGGGKRGRAATEGKDQKASTTEAKPEAKVAGGKRQGTTGGGPSPSSKRAAAAAMAPGDATTAVPGKPSNNDGKTVQQRRDEKLQSESERIVRALRPGQFVVAMDARSARVVRRALRTFGQGIKKEIDKVREMNEDAADSLATELAYVAGDDFESGLVAMFDEQRMLMFAGGGASALKPEPTPIEREAAAATERQRKERAAKDGQGANARGGDPVKVGDVLGVGDPALADKASGSAPSTGTTDTPGASAVGGANDQGGDAAAATGRPSLALVGKEGSETKSSAEAGYVPAATPAAAAGAPAAP